MHDSSGEIPKLADNLQSWWQAERADQAGQDPQNDAFPSPGLRRQFARSRSFFLPLHYTASYSYPLLVWFHSNGFNEHQIDSVMPHISLRNYVGVGIRGTRAADTMGHRFDWHHTPTAVAAAHEATCEAVEEAMRRFNIEPARVILAGFGEGGTMAQRIAFRDPHRFAGVISLGGRIPHGGMIDLAQLRQRRLPMLWQWGLQNPQYTEENLQADCRLIMTLGAELEIRQYPEDEMNTVTLGDVDEWIMRRIVAGSSIGDSQSWASRPTGYSHN